MCLKYVKILYVKREMTVDTLPLEQTVSSLYGTVTVSSYFLYEWLLMPFTRAKMWQGVFFLCAVSPTNISQYNLPPGSSSMSRSNSIPAQDSFDLYGEGHPLGGSATSLEERPRAISRSGSFRDSTDEGRTQSGTHFYIHSLNELCSKNDLPTAVRSH